MQVAFIDYKKNLCSWNAIDSYALIGAGYVRTKDTGINELWIGNLAKLIC